MSDEEIDRKFLTGKVIIIAIPSFLTVLLIITVAYLTVIVSDVNSSLNLGVCRSRVSQEIQETFRKDVSNLIILSAKKESIDRTREQTKLFLDMSMRPDFATQVELQCNN